jgi:hypothetical protein
MAANVIYRGPADRQPRTVNKSVAGAYVPGVFVTESATALTVATAGEGRLRLLTNREFAGQDVATAYTNGDTGAAYVVEPGQYYQARMAAASYTFGQPLTVGASGRLTAATSDDVVVAYFDDATGAYGAGDLANIEIANSYTATA